MYNRAKDRFRGQPTKQRYRNRYYVTGTLMLLFPLIAWLITEVTNRRANYIFAVELLGLWTFAAYWIIKSLELEDSQAEITLWCPILGPAVNTMHQIFLGALATAVAGYLLVCLLLYVGQERLIFAPEPLAADYQFSFPLRFDEVSWQVDGARLHALHFRVAAPRGAVLYLHGNAGSVRSWGAVAGTFVAQGYEVLIPDYRSFGKSTGRIAGERMLHDDARTAYRYLAARFAEEQIVVYGRSLGTGLAVALAAEESPALPGRPERRPRLLILETPYFSLHELARSQFPWAPPFLLRYPLRTDLRIGKVTCPIHLIHGTHDELIPHSASERLLPLIRTEHTLWSIAGGHHNDLASFEAYHAALAEILGAPAGR